MTLEDIGKTGRFLIIGNYAEYLYTKEEEEFLNALLAKSEPRFRSRVETQVICDLRAKCCLLGFQRNPCIYSKKYYLYHAETMLFGDSQFDISVVSDDEFYKHLSNIRHPDSNRKVREYNLKKKLDNVSDFYGYSRHSKKDMLMFFYRMFGAFEEHYESIGRTYKFVENEDFQQNYKDKVEVVNMKWWYPGIPAIGIEGRNMEPPLF